MGRRTSYASPVSGWSCFADVGADADAEAEAAVDELACECRWSEVVVVGRATSSEVWALCSRVEGGDGRILSESTERDPPLARGRARREPDSPTAPPALLASHLFYQTLLLLALRLTWHSLSLSFSNLLIFFCGVLS